MFGNFFKELLKNVLEGYQQEDLNQKVLDFREKIMDESFPIEHLGNPTSVKTLNKYVEIKARAGELFSKIKKGHPRPLRQLFIIMIYLNFGN